MVVTAGFLSHLRLSQAPVKRGNGAIKFLPSPIDASVDGPLQLLDLPEELLIRTLAYLPFKSLISYRSISHAFNSLITESTRLQYVIALETHRFINNPNSPLPLAERLRRLQAREEAWRLLKPSSNQWFDIPHQASWVHDLNGDTFLLGDAVTGEKVIGPNGSEIWGTKAIGCLSLSSFERSTVGLASTWKSFNVGNDIINATMAIHEHDLIALATMRLENQSFGALSAIEIQLLQFSTGNPHPSATMPSLLVTRAKQDAARPGVSFEIVGRYLAVLVEYGTSILDYPDQFIIFDWKVGTVIMSSKLPFGMYDSLTFLDEQTLLLSNLHEGSLDIVPIPATAPTDPQPLTRICSLVLPQLRNPFWYRIIECRTDPKTFIPSHSRHDTDHQDPHPSPTSPILPHAQKPFCPSPSSSIVLFHIGVQNTEDPSWGLNGMRVYSLIIHRQSLLANIPPPSLRHTRIIPWKDWGPRSTRLLDSHDISTRMVTACAGERYVRLAPDRRIHVLDFNPHHVRLQTAAVAGSSPSTAAQNEDAGGSVQVVSEKTMLTHGTDKNPWQKKLYTELPYVLSVSNEVYPRMGGVVMDEERIIGLELKVKDRISSISVLRLN